MIKAIGGRFAALLTTSILSFGTALSARAADLDTTKSPPAPPPTLASDWFSTITHTVQFEAGIAGNPDDPALGSNFGQLFTDRANEPTLNQVLFTLARPVDETKAWDVGFNLQGLYGSDARYDPTLGILDYAITGRYQFVFTQANLVIHSPFPVGSLDTKIGLYPGAMGYETTDPSTRPFYTLSYVSNFLLPFENFGVLSTWHVNPTVDIYAGIDAGNETTPWQDNNAEPAGYLGVGLNNLLDNKLTVLAVSRVGPEDSTKVLGPAANDYFRFWNDVTATYKLNDQWAFTVEANYFKDDGLKAADGQRADAYGVDGYIAYTINDWATFNLRGEIFRDNTGLVVTEFPTNTGFTSAIAGNPDFFVNAPPTTYGDVTAGVTLKPPFLNSNKFAKVTIRPEVRYDSSLNGTQPFGYLTKSNQVLLSTDVIVAF